ncbi:MAG: SH3 domain-containing protein [Spirochaetaceae bacterium]|nr:SH3 domain-containing protein [Spirochaetaceae bacterium]
MKRKFIFFVFIMMSTMSVFAQAGAKRYVSVEHLKVKSGTGFFSSTVETIVYGAEVVLLEESGKYTKIQTASGKTGWVSTNSLTKKKIIQNSNVNASADEIALAGKGFTAEIEAEYKKSNTYNYAAVDTLETKSISNEELRLFLERRALTIQ